MPERTAGLPVRIEPWTDADLELLRRVNSPEMKAHVGGPETDEQVLLRHRRYLSFVPEGRGCSETVCRDGRKRAESGSTRVLC